MKLSKKPVEEKRIYNVDDVSAMLKISKSKAYKIIQQLNRELKDMGKITIAGQISKKYFDEKVYL